jgi:dephospho-CoA kinase
VFKSEAARRSGFVRVPGQWFGTDQQGVDHPEEVVVDADPSRPVNINIRPVTAPIWRETLLFRDWLRSHDDKRNAYAELKRSPATGPQRRRLRHRQDALDQWCLSRAGQ